MYDFSRLTEIGISFQDARALRRISMTLHRWHELEWGDGNNYASWSIARGRSYRENGERKFEYLDEGKPYLERHAHNENRTTYSPIPDRENGAKRRLTKIMANYPTLSAYIQTDPRGAALYVLQPGDVPPGATIDSCYSNGVAVYK